MKNNIQEVEALILGIKKFVFFRLMMDNKIRKPTIPHLV